MIRIAIVGLGGVGGFIGGLLAHKYKNSGNIEITFICRGEHKKRIQETGLQLETKHENFLVNPHLITDDPIGLGYFDIILFCTKSYHLNESLILLKNNINKNTKLLSLSNGLDSYEKLKSAYPASEICKACIYIVSRLIAPGIVKESGGFHNIFFGTQNGNQESLNPLEQILVNANINAKYTSQIDQQIWEKFLFISPVATLTSFLNKTIGEFCTESKHIDTLFLLVEELKLLANQKGIPISLDINDTILKRIKSLPKEATSSMHSDFQNGNQTELESLTGYVVKLGKNLKIKTTNFEIMYEHLKSHKPSKIESWGFN